MPREGEGAVVRQGHLIAMVAFLIGCAFLLGVGCAGTRSETFVEEQVHIQATTNEQTRSPEATNKEQGHSAGEASEEEARCQGTQPYDSKNAPGAVKPYSYTTDDLPGCPSGGLLFGGGQEGSKEPRSAAFGTPYFGAQLDIPNRCSTHSGEKRRMPVESVLRERASSDGGVL
jgi:hypothetical protein